MGIFNRGVRHGRPMGPLASVHSLPNMPRMLAVRAIAIDRQVQCDLGVFQGFVVESSRLVATRSTQLRNNRQSESQPNVQSDRSPGDPSVWAESAATAEPGREKLSGLWESLDKGLLW
jgi:hypothetical protein